jgi:predicted transcriptional regulator
LKSNKIITASIYNKILREFGNNEEKTKNLILKLNELIGKKISTDIKNTEIEVNEKIAEENEIYSSFILEKD